MIESSPFGSLSEARTISKLLEGTASSLTALSFFNTEMSNNHDFISLLINIFPSIKFHVEIENEDELPLLDVWGTGIAPISWNLIYSEGILILMDIIIIDNTRLPLYTF